MWKYHGCYGYIINRAFHTKKLLKWNGFVVYVINNTREGKFRISARPCNKFFTDICPDHKQKQSKQWMLNIHFLPFQHLNSRQNPKIVR